MKTIVLIAVDRNGRPHSDPAQGGPLAATVAAATNRAAARHRFATVLGASMADVHVQQLCPRDWSKGV